ncbi:MAG TPA: phospholipid carrier-dependent glycosyltransferase [Anaerolineales bacterium]|nr:phospholipid carrier-dependent glycosyltransferase [Anaerolineales bacterium]
MTARHLRFASILTFGLLALSGTFLILYATPQGMGLSDDSIAYIAGARSILDGQGYREAWLASNQPVTHFPPGFSTILAIVGLSGLDPLRGTRFVNALVFGANIFLLGLIGWRMTQSKIAGILLGVLFLLNGQLFRVHTTAMSEPLYIFFTLAAFLAFSNYGFQQFTAGQAGASSRTPKVWLLLTAILTAFAYLTRYAGLALLATFLVSLFILHTDWRARLTSAGIFLAGFIPFALAWSIRNRLLADNATNRQLVYHPITAENIQLGISNIAAFLFPVEAWRRELVKIPNLFAFVIVILVLILLAWVIAKGWKKLIQPTSEMPELLSFVNVLYIFGYLASILSSMTLFDASTKFQLRILAPVYVGLLIILVYFGWRLWQKNAISSRFTFYASRITFFVFAFYVLATSILNFTGTLAQLRKGGQGYASFQWFDSQAMAFLSQLPKDTRIYSNQVGPVYLYTGRPGYVLPDLVDPVTGLPRERYAESVELLQADVLSGEATLALFKYGSQDEDVQSVYLDLADGLHLAFDERGDKIYTAFP